MPAPPRVVLIGASNLARNLGVAVETARHAAGGPVREVFLAAGHGRSYGQSSQVLFRGLPSILDCGLWRSLEGRPKAPIRALLTDVGNDIGYGSRPEEILGWVETCAARLGALGARVVLTALPIARLRELGAREIGWARKIFFPSSTVGVEEIRARIEALDAGLRELAARRGLDWVEQQRGWYGFDPLHIRRRAAPAAWREILAPFLPEAEGTPPRLSLARTLRLKVAPPERRWLFGFERCRAQPSCRLPESCALWAF